jgi:hypothetical protein
MPARVIRGEINASRSLERVSMLADLTFRALLVAVDDYGRTDGRLHVLKAALFPTRREVTDAKLDAWLAELAREGCVVRYEIDGAPYLALTNWERHRGKGRRGGNSRYPEPPRASADFLGRDDASSDFRARVEGRGTRDEGREARDEGRGCPSAPAERGAADAIGPVMLPGVEAATAEPPADSDPAALLFAEQFRDALARFHPGWKPPTEAAFARWVRDARLLLRERGDEAARETARWLFDAGTPNADAEFWRSVVLSVPKFRERFDQIAAQRNRAPPRRRGGFDPDEAKRVALKVLRTKGGLE